MILDAVDCVNNIQRYQNKIHISLGKSIEQMKNV